MAFMGPLEASVCPIVSQVTFSRANRLGENLLKADIWQ